VSRGGVVGISTRLRAGLSGVRIPVIADFLFSQKSDRAWNPLSFLSNALLGRISGAVRVERTVDPSLVFSAKFKSEWGFTYTPLMPPCRGDKKKLLTLIFMSKF
jgi:hypothetical protein